MRLSYITKDVNVSDFDTVTAVLISIAHLTI